MFTESQQLEIVRVELNSVFYQRFSTADGLAGSAHATTAELFKPIETTQQAYIEEVYKGSGLFPIIGETTNVPLQLPVVANKVTTAVKDFASGIEISKNLFDDNIRPFLGRSMLQVA